MQRRVGRAGSLRADDDEAGALLHGDALERLGGRERHNASVRVDTGPVEGVVELALGAGRACGQRGRVVSVHRVQLAAEAGSEIGRQPQHREIPLRAVGLGPADDIPHARRVERGDRGLRHRHDGARGPRQHGARDTADQGCTAAAQTACGDDDQLGVLGLRGGDQPRGGVAGLHAEIGAFRKALLFGDGSELPPQLSVPADPGRAQSVEERARTLAHVQEQRVGVQVAGQTRRHRGGAPISGPVVDAAQDAAAHGISFVVALGPWSGRGGSPMGGHTHAAAAGIRMADGGVALTRTENR